jgi:hypothetical protein
LSGNASKNGVKDAQVKLGAELWTGRKIGAFPPQLTPSLRGLAYAVFRRWRQRGTAALLIEAAAPTEVFVMAIQEYVRSIAATDTVSKAQVFRFLEMQFARADKNHDGQLDFDELVMFAQSVVAPETDQR